MVLLFGISPETGKSYGAVEQSADSRPVSMPVSPDATTIPACQTAECEASINGQRSWSTVAPTRPASNPTVPAAWLWARNTPRRARPQMVILKVGDTARVSLDVFATDAGAEKLTMWMEKMKKMMGGE